MTCYVPRLSPDQFEQAVSQNHELWGAGRSLADHILYNREQLDRAGPELLRYVGLIDGAGEVLASIKRYSLTLQIGGAPLRAVGIGAVYTRFDRRMYGLAGRLIESVKREAADLGYAAAFLYSDIDPKMYAKYGFVALDALDHEASVLDLPAEAPLAVRPAREADLDHLIALYDQSFHFAVARPRRSRAAWRYFAWRNRVTGCYVLRDGARDVGYMLATREDPLRDLPEPAADSLWLDEWSAPGVDRARILATARMLAEHAGASRVRAWLRPHVHEAGEPFVARPRKEAIPMIAPLGKTVIDPRSAWLGAFDHF